MCRYSWNRLIRTRLFRIPRYFELKTLSLGSVLQSFTIGYFELPLFRTIFRSPCEVEIAGFNSKSILAPPSSYQECPVAFKLMTSQMVQRAQPLTGHILPLGRQRVKKENKKLK